MIPLWLLASSVLSAPEPVRLASVPTALPDSTRERLVVRREVIRDVIRRYNAAIQAFNGRCSGVTSNDARYAACDRERGTLTTGASDIEDAKRAFNTEVEASLRQAQLVPAIRFANVVITGDVHFQGPDGKPIDAARLASLDIPLGTKITTGPGGSFRADAPGLHTLHVGAGAELTIDSVFVSPSSLRQLDVSLAHGFFRWLRTTADDARRDSRSGRFRVRSPTITAAVRGTDVHFEFDQSGAGTVRLYTGDVVVTSPDSTRRVELKPGFMLTITRDGRISEPVALRRGSAPPPATAPTYSPRRVP